MGAGDQSGLRVVGERDEAVRASDDSAIGALARRADAGVGGGAGCGGAAVGGVRGGEGRSGGAGGAGGGAGRKRGRGCRRADCADGRAR